MEDNKYYVPTLEEFHPGFEFEAYNSNDWFFAEAETGWKKQEWRPQFIAYQQAQNILGAIQNGWIRVKYLDKEDIESLGWKFNERVRKADYFNLNTVWKLSIIVIEY
jgi:hypothetical protein